MTIKDVEKLTGLTAKSIRYYEGKGLLTVERNEENDYRSYSEAEVKRLKKIKLLRYLDFSVEEVKAMLDLSTDAVIEKLQKKSERFLEESDRCKDKQNLCLALAKDYKKNTENQDKMIDEYNEVIDFWESDEMAELGEEMLDIAMPNLSTTIGATLVCLGPILWLFINIQAGMLDKLMLNAIMAILATVFATWNWIYYITERRKYKERVKKKNRKNVWMFPVMIFSIIVGLAAVAALFTIPEKLLAPENYLFSEHHPVAGAVIVWLAMIPVILVTLIVVAKLTKKTRKEMDEMNDILFVWNALGRFKVVAVIVWIVATYCCLTSINFVTEDKIVCHTPLQPLGVEYRYEDVENITTGFGDSSFSFVTYKRKGEFYYQLELDGKTVVFHQPYTNLEIERYSEDSYLELEEFDQKLMKLGISKDGDIAGYQNVMMDQVYVDRFIRIIENK